MSLPVRRSLVLLGSLDTVLQVKHGWDWLLQWVPRELNEAADALSKHDTSRFLQNARTELSDFDVPQSALELPSGRSTMPARDVAALVYASGPGHNLHDRPTQTAARTAREQTQRRTLARPG